MAPTITAAQAATDKAVLRLKVACQGLERHLPAPDPTDQDDTMVSEAPSIRPEQRRSSVVECALCADEIQQLQVGDRGGHVCTHQGGGGDEREGSETDSEAHQPVARVGKRRQPNEGVLNEYVEKMEERMDALVQATAMLCSVAEKEDVVRHEDHLLRWANFCEGLKDRTRDVVEMIMTVRQEEADRQFAIQVAKDQAASAQPQERSGVSEAPPADSVLSSAPSSTAVAPSIPPPSTASLAAPSRATTISTSTTSRAPIVTSAASGGVGTGGCGISDLEIATKAVNSLARAVDEDIVTMEAEVNSMGEVVEENQIADLRHFCASVEDRIKGEMTRAGEKLARLDLNRQTNILEFLDEAVDIRLAKLRGILASVRRARSASARSNQSSVSSVPSSAVNQNFRPYMEKLKVPVFSGKVEDFPEFRSVWRDMLSSHPESIQVQYIKGNVPAKDSRRIAGVKTMEEVWKRLEKVYGDTQLNIVTVKASLENLVPKAAENYKRVLEVYEAVEAAVTQLTNLDALQYIKEDFSLMNKIVLKLPSEYQDQFAEYITSDPVRADASSRWDKFWVWMERLHRRAVESSLMNMCGSGGNKVGAVKTGGSTIKSGITCNACGGVGHFARTCPTKGRADSGVTSTARFNMAVSKIATKAEYDQHLPEVKKKSGDCPLCKKPAHVYTRQFPFGKAEWPSRRLDNCPLFMSKTAKERGEIVEKAKACYKCTGWFHQGDACFIKTRSNCSVVAGGKACGGVHHKLLHGSGVAFCHKVHVVAADGDREDDQLDQDRPAGLPDINAPVLLEIQTIVVNSVGAKTMWDGGSSGALITHSFAEKANLRGEKVAYYLVVVGHPRVLRHTTLYTFIIVDNQGREHEVQAYGIDKITEDTVILDLSGVRAVFPGAPSEVYERPAGEIDILIGSMYKNIQPWGGDDEFTRGRLRLMKSLFGCGYILTGTHPP